MTKTGSSCLLLAASLLVGGINGCDQSARLERRAPQDISLVKSYFDLLREGHSDQVEQLLHPDLQRSESRASFDELVATIPQEAPRSVKAVLVGTRCSEGTCEDHIILEYRYSSERLLFNVRLLKEADQISILGIYIRVIPESFMKANEFTLANRGFPQYAILTLALLFPALSIYVLILCIRAQIGPRKWTWAAFIVLGISRLGVNWNTGQLNFNLLSIQILSAGASAEQYEPWVIAVSVPLGAICFLINYRSLLFYGNSDKPPQRKMPN